MSPPQMMVVASRFLPMVSAKMAEAVVKAGSSTLPITPFQIIVLALAKTLANSAVETGPISSLFFSASSSKSLATRIFESVGL